MFTQVFFFSALFCFFRLKKNFKCKSWELHSYIFWQYCFFLILSSIITTTLPQRLCKPALPSELWPSHQIGCLHVLKTSLVESLSMSSMEIWQFNNTVLVDDSIIHDIELEYYHFWYLVTRIHRVRLTNASGAGVLCG